VMNAAAKAARSEMLQRVRENKAGNGEGGKRQRAPAEGSGARSGNGNGGGNRAAQGKGQQQQRPPRQGNAGRNANTGAGGNVQRPPRHDGDAQPREGAHNSASPFVVRDPVQRQTDGQPDPLRTSVDIMAKSGRRGGGGGGRSNRSGGGGVRSRGPGNPARTFGR